ncbi:cytochrome P450 [Leptodontidium sp. MPI-SDFR-AT-0119]|nr:cytochrome P450 [Leptodontidium sp. MPI-SDFR-AT-0119]
MVFHENILLCGTTAFLLLAALPIAAIFYLLVEGVYNVYFHPLSKFPGLKLHAASRIDYARDLISRKYAYKIIEYHDKYRDVVRVAPNELSYIDSAAWKDIYATRAGQPQMQKDPNFFQTLDKTPNIFLSNDADHSRIRRLLAHAFSDKALLEEESIIYEYVDLMVSKLKEVSAQGVPTNIVNWFKWTTFDLFGDLYFGQSFQCL